MQAKIKESTKAVIIFLLLFNPWLLQNGMHTLCLLDIKVKEPDFAKMTRGKIAYLPPRYMTVSPLLLELMAAVYNSPVDMRVLPLYYYCLILGVIEIFL